MTFNRNEPHIAREALERIIDIHGLALVCDMLAAGFHRLEVQARKWGL